MRVVAGLVVLAFLSVWARSVDTLPHGFTKHGEAWTIRYVGVVDADATNDAVTFCAFKRVDVRKDIQGRELAKALLHEIMHALACDGSFKQDQKWNNSGDKDDGEDGHAGIYWGSGELLAFIQDNPQFVEFLVTTK
ncbi:MAG TPA: hypothetical protein VGQ12_07685 [Candidatus Angelobacter sp.]|jgi:hypothetical protein|nr:hypothetical protein [Candidatus Angelobacter sp.]